MRCPGLLLACSCLLALVVLPLRGSAQGVAFLTGELEASWGGGQQGSSLLPLGGLSKPAAASMSACRLPSAAAAKVPLLSGVQVPPVDTPSEAFWNATVVGDRCHWTLQVCAPAEGQREPRQAGEQGLLM